MPESAPKTAGTPDEWVRIDPGRRCPFLLCLVDAAHEHPVCPDCGAVRFGNISCGTCKRLRRDDMNPHRLVSGP